MAAVNGRAGLTLKEAEGKATEANPLIFLLQWLLVYEQEDSWVQKKLELTAAEFGTLARVNSVINSGGDLPMYLASSAEGFRKAVCWVHEPKSSLASWSVQWDDQSDDQNIAPFLV
eukprot:Gb_00569 [translate_table: standard]